MFKILTSAIIIFTSCVNNNSQKQESIELENLITESYSFTDTIQFRKVDIGYENLILQGPLKKEYKGNESDIISTGCENWFLKENDLKGLLLNMRIVEPVEWNSICYNYPCYYVGEVANEIKKYKLIINAGSYVELRSENETLYFVLEKESGKFLIPCNCCE